MNEVGAEIPGRIDIPTATDRSATLRVAGATSAVKRTQDLAKSPRCGASTGPRTPEGLERSRRATLKHGRYSREAIEARRLANWETPEEGKARIEREARRADGRIDREARLLTERIDRILERINELVFNQ